jgi:hypothetical protein
MEGKLITGLSFEEQALLFALLEKVKNNLENEKS